LVSIFGIELKANFSLPYFAKNPREFWQKWHISLSLWFKDYLYKPLRNENSTFLRLSAALLVTFLVSGLWHGAGWNFIIWGFYHGVIIIIYRILNKSWDKINIIIQTTITFILVSIGWIFFRCGNLDSLMTIKDFNLFDTEYNETGIIILIISICYLLHYLELNNLDKIMNLRFTYQNILYAFLAVLVIYMSDNSKTFIYFQF